MTIKESDRLTLVKGDPESYKQTVERQREDAIGLADIIQRGDPLPDDPGSRWFIASILRAWAVNLKDTLPDSEQSNACCEFNHEDAALAYALLRRRGKSNSEAIGDVASICRVEDNSIRRAIEPYKDIALAHFGVNIKTLKDE